MALTITPVQAGADAAKALAAHWGHAEWSDSWARLVSETVLHAAKKATL